MNAGNGRDGRDDAVVTQLRELLHEFGSELLEDPRRLEAMLRDAAPSARREIKLLIDALDEEVPQALDAGASDPGGTRRLIRMQTERLQHEGGLASDAAAWAVEAWARALDLPTSSPPPPPPPPPGPQHDDTPRRPRDQEQTDVGPESGDREVPEREPHPPRNGRSERWRQPAAWALAGVVVLAVIGFVAFSSRGGGGEPGADASASPTPVKPSDTSSEPASEPDEPSETVDPEVVAALEDHIAPELADDCGPQAPGNQPAQGMLVCESSSIPGPDLVSFTLYRSSTDTVRSYRAIINDEDITSGTGELDSCPGAEFPYQEGGVEVGRVACYIDDEGDASITWMHEDLMIDATAYTSGEDFDDLVDWWRGSESGLYYPPADEEDLDDLVARVPSDLRGGCNEYRHSIPTVVVEVTCEGGDTPVDVVWYSQYETTDDAMAGYDFLLQLHDQARDVGGASDCPGAEFDYTINDEHAGRVACATASDSDNAGRVFWIDEDLAIVGEAYRSNSDFKAMMEWWFNDSGPVR